MLQRHFLKVVCRCGGMQATTVADPISSDLKSVMYHGCLQCWGVLDHMPIRFSTSCVLHTVTVEALELGVVDLVGWAAAQSFSTCFNWL